MKKTVFSFLYLITSLFVSAQKSNSSLSLQFIKDNYTKLESMIPMRDGIKLYTAIYIPKDSAEAYPFLLMRTPYSCSPYGPNNYSSNLGPTKDFIKEKYIFVYQDVRGRYMSEGNFQEMTPAIDHKKSNTDVDESSDTYDTIDWLLKNIKNNNGRAGIYGISYPGFYASAALPDAHPALRAVSPQAPVTDEFDGDDANHRGAFFLMDNFSFMNFFDHPRLQPWQQYPPVNNNIKITDVYDFYLKAGAIKNLNRIYFHDSSKIWNEYLAHTTKDEYWQARNIRPHFTNIKPAVLVIGGWFDAEDMFGALKTYEAISQQSPATLASIVMGPWTHGAWSRNEWSSFGGTQFGTNTNLFIQQKELDFFNFYLKNKGSYNKTKATVFVTGSNKWQSFHQWPPSNVKPVRWTINENHQLLLNNTVSKGYDAYISDPANPVPYINKVSDDRINEYMIADQSFASKRNDVLYYSSPILEKDITLLGGITANLSVSISGTDADFIVKVIDILPDGKATQQLVRAEILRGKFRNSYTDPEPFIPGEITSIHLQLNDVAHTFLKGHRIMIQIQSSWFPLTDRNPQQFMNIADANDQDFQKSTIHIYHNTQYPSTIDVFELKK